MLKRIPSILSPELVSTLMEMGHGDELVLADANFPSASLGRRLVRCDGLGIPMLMDAILELFPLDQYSERPVALMAVVPGDPLVPTIWEEYAGVVARRERSMEFEWVERFAFYERARRAFGVVATGERALYANVILKKGVVEEGRTPGAGLVSSALSHPDFSDPSQPKPHL
jgi:L-fucose mutarotase